MSNDQSEQKVLLKILSGIQSGVEVHLAPGTYTIGSGQEDDIQLIDVSLEPEHAQLRIDQGKASICATKGTIVTAKGIMLADGSDTWQELEDLEIVTAGTMKFATGPIGAKWSTLADIPKVDRDPSISPEKKKTEEQYSFSWLSSVPWLSKIVQRLPVLPAGVRQVVFPLLLLVASVFVILLIVPFVGSYQHPSSMEREEQVQLVRNRLDQFSFGRVITVKQEVDGDIFVTGYVENIKERRALVKEVQQTNLPVKFRIAVLELLRREVTALIDEEKLPVTFALNKNGVLTLQGLILDQKRATRFINRVERMAIGLREIKSRIRTAETLLASIKRLTRNVDIDKYVLLRLDGAMVEASGILPDDKVELWVEFLQAYSNRFARDIGLRSLVMLQSKEGAQTKSSPHKSIILGGKQDSSKYKGSNVSHLDLERLGQGLYSLHDIFVNQIPSSRGGSDSKVADSRPSRRPSSRSGSKLPLFSTVSSLLGSSASYSYMPLDLGSLVSPPRLACDSMYKITLKNIGTVLFWLDLLSMTTHLQLADFQQNEQWSVLEAALNPSSTSRCLKEANLFFHFRINSYYLTEIRRNPAFLRFIIRGMNNNSLPITGVNLIAPRYVQLSNGIKLKEGTHYDARSKLSIIGELGAGMRVKGGFSVVAYGKTLNWSVDINTLKDKKRIQQQLGQVRN